MSAFDTILEYYDESDLKGLSPKELFNKWLMIEGIIGYTDKIINAVDDLYCLGLDACTCQSYDDESNDNDLSPWVKCYRNALNGGSNIDEAIQIADETIGRAEFEEE